MKNPVFKKQRRRLTIDLKDTKMMSEVSSDEEFITSSETESDVWGQEEHVKPQEASSKCSIVSFIMGISLTAPFITFVCASQDVLAGTSKPTGLVTIGLTAPSVVLKIVSLCLRQVSQVPRVFLAFAFVIAGQLCVVFTPHLEGRLAGLCLVSVGTGIGEISLLIQAAVEFEEIVLCSFIVGTGVGAILGSVTYVGLTVWLIVDPRTAILVSAIWPPVFLITFAVSQGKLTSSRYLNATERLSRIRRSKFEIDCRLTTRWKQRLYSVWSCSHHMLLLFLIYFSEYIILTAILTTLVFDGVGVGPEFSPRGDFEHYVLSTMMGEFLGRSFISMLRAVAPGFFFNSSPVLAFFPLAETIFLVLATWFRLVSQVWIIWLLCFVQGTACGMIFSNSYHIIARRVVSNHVAFNVTLASILETAGILTAGLVGLYVESALKDHCMHHERNISDCFARDIDSTFWEFGHRLFYEGKTALSL